MKNSILFNKILGVFFAIVFIFLISLILYFTKNNTLVFSSPLYIIKETFLLIFKYNTYCDLFYTILRLILCLFISFLLALILSYFSYKYSLFESFINPFVIIFRSTPIICISVLFIIIFSAKSSCYIITCLILFPLFYESFMGSFKSIDKSIIDSYKLDTKFNIKVLLKLYLPISITHIKASLIEGIGLGFKVMITSEYLSGTNKSIGDSLFKIYQNNIDMTYVYAYALFIIIISFVLTNICNLIKKKI